VWCARQRRPADIRQRPADTGAVAPGHTCRCVGASGAVSANTQSRSRPARGSRRAAPCALRRIGGAAVLRRHVDLISWRSGRVCGKGHAGPEAVGGPATRVRPPRREVSGGHDMAGKAKRSQVWTRRVRKVNARGAKISELPLAGGEGVRGIRRLTTRRKAASAQGSDDLPNRAGTTVPPGPPEWGRPAPGGRAPAAETFAVALELPVGCPDVRVAPVGVLCDLLTCPGGRPRVPRNDRTASEELARSCRRAVCAGAAVTASGSKYEREQWC
jgi:hypothetical protein